MNAGHSQDKGLPPSKFQEPELREDVVLRGSPIRCPYCRDEIDFKNDRDWVACCWCVTRHHDACWREGKACATCGHERSVHAEGIDPIEGLASWFFYTVVTGLGLLFGGGSVGGLALYFDLKPIFVLLLALAGAFLGFAALAYLSSNAIKKVLGDRVDVWFDQVLKSDEETTT